jgi:glyoxylase-like metal-dependent hydrolase (beta-lactamase superfamily II)
MRLGELEVSLFNFGMFRLDGGSMFGSVPKNLWSKRIPVDDENCIPLATRCLIIKRGDDLVLVDCGMGEKWNEKLRQIYAVQNVAESEWPFDRHAVTHLILTHLHFDHAGGTSRYAADGKTLELTFPNAKVFLQRANLENAEKPTLKERASYLPENVQPLKNDQLVLVEGSVEVYPGITVHQIDGHTKGQQWVEIRGDGKALYYPTDLIPTSRHLPLPYHMGYDACATTVLGEKEKLLARAVEEDAVLVFEHDPDTAAATIKLDERGHYAVRERVEI